jgi:hypothetical protein
VFSLAALYVLGFIVLALGTLTILTFQPPSAMASAAGIFH